MTALAIAAAYLIGSISPSYLLFRMLRGEDIRRVGSGNPGATNVLRTVGRRPAIVVLLADVAKGAVPVLAARQLGLTNTAMAGVAFAAVTGHVFSIFMRFRGGKGVATAAGAFGAIDLGATALSGLVFLIVVAGTRYVSAGSMIAVVAFPLVAVVGGRFSGTESPATEFLVAAGAIALLILFKHKANIVNLAHGCERRLGERVANGREP